jgi:hypothetical protein
MAKRKTEGPPKPTNPRAKRLKPVMVRLEPAQIQALKTEALRRSNERGSLKPDVSELVREALVGWLNRR